MVRVGDNSIFRFLTSGKPPDTNFFEPKRQEFGTSCVNPKTFSSAFENSSIQKKILVFDRSKNGTKLLFGPPMQNPDKQSGDFYTNRDDFGINPKLDLNCPVLEEESEMHEDTEEINALLYSDDSCDYRSEEDDVTSTGHTPSTMLELCGKRERFDELKDEISTFKRRKLLSGADKPSIGLVLSKKDKIGQTLKIMEGIVPGVKGKDPIVILDGAIQYLKAMKLRAQVIAKNLH